MTKSRLLLISFAVVITALVLGTPGTRDSILRQKPREASSPGLSVKSHGSPLDRHIPEADLLSRSDLTLASGAIEGFSATMRAGKGAGTSGGGNAFVNDPCLDPAPTDPFPLNFFDTVQSETEIAVLSSINEADDESDGDDASREVAAGLMVAGYNDSRGFRRQPPGT